jgi:hypothetical protein
MARSSLFLALAAAGAVLAGPALAHHSFAMFDLTKTLDFPGTVQDFQWSNPHAVIWVVADSKPGAAPEVWTIELTSPGNLTRTGWNRRILKEGDKVNVEINPLRDGQHGGALRKVTIVATGQVLTSTLTPPKPGT